MLVTAFDCYGVDRVIPEEWLWTAFHSQVHKSGGLEKPTNAPRRPGVPEPKGHAANARATAHTSASANCPDAPAVTCSTQLQKERHPVVRGPVIQRTAHYTGSLCVPCAYCNCTDTPPPTHGSVHAG